MPPTSSTARSRTSAPPCSAAASTGRSSRSAADSARRSRRRTEDWRASAKIRRLWQHDKSVWTGTDEDKWLGWLNSAGRAPMSPTTRTIAHKVKGQNFTDAVVLGMGGSSLGPEVLAETFAQAARLSRNCMCWTSTDPAQVRACRPRSISPKPLFIVSSKSGGTTEPNVMKDYFFARVAKAIGADKAGHRFIAVTDPGSSLEKVADQTGLCPHLPWRSHHRRPLLGAVAVRAGAGRDRRHRRSRTLLEHTLSMVRSCGPDVPPQENPGVQLGLAMGLAGLEGRDKVTILSSKKIADFGAWAEQLIAESTGKDGKGLIPIDGEPLGDPAVYGNDRFFIDIRTEGEDDAAHDDKLAALEKAGHPVVRIVHEIDRPYRPGILPVRNRDRGRRLDARHQPVQPARRRGRQDQDPRIDRGVREIRRAAARRSR